MRTVAYILYLMILSISSALAQEQVTGGGSEAGNGGSAIVCLNPDQSIKSVELLDFYEGTTKRGLVVDLGSPQLTVEEKMALILKRLNHFSSTSATEIEVLWQGFFKKARFYRGIRLIEVPDSNHLYVPSGCQQEQVAVQREPTVPEDKLYNVSADLWDRLSNDAKAGLIFHELLYRYALERKNIRDSQDVRYFVSKLTSATVAEWSLFHYVAVARKLGIFEVSSGDYSFIIEDELPKFARTGPGDNYVLRGGPIFGGGLIEVLGRRLEANAIYFANDGKTLESFSLSSPVQFNIDGHQVWAAPNSEITIGRKDGKEFISSLELIGEDPVEFVRPGFYQLKLDPKGLSSIHLLFNQEGLVEYCKSCKGQVHYNGTLFDISGVVDEKYGQLYSFQFDSNFGPEVERLSLYLGEPKRLEFPQGVVELTGTTVFFKRKVYQSNLARPTELKLGSYRATFVGHVVFSETGHIEEGILDKSAELLCIDGKVIRFLKGMKLKFDDQGIVQGSYADDGRLQPVMGDSK